MGEQKFVHHWHHCIVSLSKNINPSLVLVQPRKTRPFITERLLMGRKESNQTNKQTKVCSNGPGHRTKMAAIPYGKNPLKISRTRRQMTLGLGMKHLGCGPYKVCSNYCPRLTLIYLMLRSNLLPSAFIMGIF